VPSRITVRSATLGALSVGAFSLTTILCVALLVGPAPDLVASASINNVAAHNVPSQSLRADSPLHGGVITATQTAGETMYTKAKVHVRSGPSTEYGITRTLLKGAKVTVVGSKKGWNADRTANVAWSKISTGGWISSDLLTKTKAGVPLNDTGNEVRKAIGGSVNVRSGPSTEYGIIKQIPEGTKVTVVSTKRGWSAVDGKTVEWSKISTGGWIVSYALGKVSK